MIIDEISQIAVASSTSFTLVNLLGLWNEAIFDLKTVLLFEVSVGSASPGRKFTKSSQI